jgi:hypothetical protein
LAPGWLSHDTVSLLYIWPKQVHRAIVQFWTAVQFDGKMSFE